VFQYPKAASIRLSLTRELLRELAYKPFEAARRVVVVRDADRMREDQYSALLKSIEEPGASTVWILTTARLARCRPRSARAASACASRRFREPLVREFLIEAREGRSARRACSRRSAAARWRARSRCATRRPALELRNQALALLEPALRGDPATLWKAAQGFARFGRAGARACGSMIEFHQLWLRDLLRARYGAPREDLVHRDREAEIRKLGRGRGRARDPPPAAGAGGGAARDRGQRGARRGAVLRLSRVAGARLGRRRMAAGRDREVGLLSACGPHLRCAAAVRRVRRAPSPAPRRPAAAPRAGRDRIHPGFVETVIADSIDSPVSMAVAPDGRVFVCEQGGRLRVIQGDRCSRRPFVTLPVAVGAEEGLIGRRVRSALREQPMPLPVLHRARSPRARPHRALDAAGDTRAARERGTRSSSCDDNGDHVHVGGALRFGRDGKLYAGTGENGVGEFSAESALDPREAPAHRSDGRIPATIRSHDRRGQTPRDLGARDCATRLRSTSSRRAAASSSTTWGRTRSRR
jgi:hypothetical protein